MSERIDPADPEIVAAFRVELAELLDGLAVILSGLLSSDAAPGATSAAGSPSPATVEANKKRDLQSAFRIVHNLKGAARVAGAEPVVVLAHAMEGALERAQARGSLPSTEVLTELLDALPTLEALAMERLDPAEAKAAAARLERSADPAAGAPASRPAPASAPINEVGPAPDVTHPDQGAAADSIVRVDVKRLDRLMASVGELLPAQGRLAQLDAEIGLIVGDLVAAAGELEGRAARRVADLALRLARARERDLEASRRLAALVDDVLDAARRVRLLPLKSLVQHWQRVVRDAANALGKQVQLDIDVGDVEFDKRVLESLRDPLLHMLRNAVDHGIELPTARAARGKPERGRVVVRARTTGTMVLIEVSDDGRGMDPSRIRAEAERRGFITETQASSMQRAEILALVFRAGFSTASSVSTLSGRGVGLDVVREVIRSLGGSIEIADPPELGGATLRAKVPVSSAMIRGLLVRSAGVISALPMEHVVRAVRVRAESVKRAGGGPVAQIDRGDPLRLVWLTNAGDDGRGRSLSAGFVSLVLLASGGQKLGLVVDEIIGEEQLVTHSLPWNLKRIPGVSALFVLPDGRPAIVMDVGHFFDADPAVLAPAASPAPSADIAKRPRILVVDDSLAVRTLVRNTLQSAGYEVIVKTDGREGWDALQEQEFSLLLSDVRMPRMDGLELTRMVRADARLKNLPVILVTSLERREDLAAGAAAGANEYIVKGTMDQRRILETVARLV